MSPYPSHPVFRFQSVPFPHIFKNICFWYFELISEFCLFSFLDFVIGLESCHNIECKSPLRAIMLALHIVVIKLDNYLIVFF